MIWPKNIWEKHKGLLWDGPRLCFQSWSALTLFHALHVKEVTPFTNEHKCSIHDNYVRKIHLFQLTVVSVYRSHINELKANLTYKFDGKS